MPTFVYQLVARFPDPFCPGPDHLAARPENAMERRSTTVFTSHTIAETRFYKFREMLRAKLGLREDYPIEVATVAYEVVE